MKKPTIHQLNPQLLISYGFDINNMSDVKTYTGKKLDALQRDLLRKAFERVPEQEAKGIAKNQLIDFSTGVAVQAYPSVWFVLSELRLAKKPTGVSVSVKTSDGVNVAFRRPSLSGSDRGGLGCIESFLHQEKAGTISDLLRVNLFGDDGAGTETGFSLREVDSFQAKFYVDAIDQKEIVATAQLKITADELLERRSSAKSTHQPNQLVGKDLLFLTDAQVRRLIPYVRGAAQHLVALIAPQLSTPEGEEVFATIRIPEYDRNEAWEGLAPTLSELGIPHPLLS
ncbi:MAG: hypothetical protein LBQ02_02305 [Candidatus Nomurabacteria bacterium]|jgi:hypothetical protein|nr:hypothetical protein [Candidatus Nomurabacteria bacterium]